MQDTWKTLNDFYNPKEDRITRLINEYMQLVHKCETEPQRMAKRIDDLTEEAIKWERRADKWRSKHIKAERAIEGYEQSLKIWKDDYHRLLNKSIFVLIKERFNKWLFG